MNRFFVTVFAVFAMAMASFAQPSAVKNAAKSTFRLVCYDANGNRNAETYGVFTSPTARLLHNGRHCRRQRVLRWSTSMARHIMYAHWLA